MSVKLEMPKLSDTMTIGTVIKWLKEIGDPMARGEPFADVETDKATMPLISHKEGTLIEILTPEGARVPVGSPVALLEESIKPRHESDDESRSNLSSSEDNLTVEALHDDETPPNLPLSVKGEVLGEQDGQVSTNEDFDGETEAVVEKKENLHDERQEIVSEKEEGALEDQVGAGDAIPSNKRNISAPRPMTNCDRNWEAPDKARNRVRRSAPIAITKITAVV